MPSPETSERQLEWCFLGRVPYRIANDLQGRLRERLRQRQGREVLLLLEHPHVYTLGRNASREDVLVDQEWLRTREATVFESDRGGKVTYHGPGQLVGYPIIDLNPDRRDIRRYVRDLQEMLVLVLGNLGIDAVPGTRSEEIGVWVGERKIASIGVHISRWITTHGFALNVNTDLSYFRAIVPCGLQGVEMTSLEIVTGKRLPLAEISLACTRRFAEIFQRGAVEVKPADLCDPWPIAS